MSSKEESQPLVQSARENIQEKAKSPDSTEPAQTAPRFSGMTPKILFFFLVLGIVRGTSTIMLKVQARTQIRAFMYSVPVGRNCEGFAVCQFVCLFVCLCFFFFGGGGPQQAL